MASVKFYYTNLIQAATLKNGTGGGAPALDQVSPWTMTNAQNRDRGHVWQQSSGAWMDVDFDLTGAASNTSVGILAALGHRGAPSSAAGIDYIITQYSTNANGYPPTAASSWTNFTGGTITLGSGVRDAAAVIASPVSCRYVRFSMAVTTAFTLGRLWAGVTGTDLTIVSSPGLVRRRINPRLESRMADGMPFLTLSGDPRYEFMLPYQDMNETLYDLVAAAGIQTRSFLMLDREGTPFEVIVRGGTFTDALKFDAPDLQDTSLELESLP